MPKKFFCKRCSKVIVKNEMFVPTFPGIKNKWNHEKVCKECFEIILNKAFNGGDEINGSRK